MHTLTQRLVAEFIGTFVLVFFAVGSAVFGLNKIGAVGVALAFGLVLLALAYAIGPLTGCHVNPAVTLGVLVNRGISVGDATGYWIAQFLGGIAGAALIKLLTTSFGKVKDQTGVLGTNNWGTSISMWGDFLFEVVLTALLVVVVIMVTARTAAPGFAGLAIGLTLTVIHLVGIPVDGTSVNPARSLGPALFEGGQALSRVWLYIAAPLVGAILGVAVAMLLAFRELPSPADQTGVDVPVKV
jgi:aquaporin Z